MGYSRFLTAFPSPFSIHYADRMIMDLAILDKFESPKCPRFATIVNFAKWLHLEGGLAILDPHFARWLLGR